MFISTLGGRCGCHRGALVLNTAQAANWLMLQGTEPAGTADAVKVWGFVQPTYSQTDGSKVAAGPFKGRNFQPNLIAPDLTSKSQFSLMRARLGVRGSNFPLDSKTNYFLMAEFGNNGITTQAGGATVLTDASVTLNHIPGARIRLGQFKTPISEEVFQAIGVFDYINLTSMANQQLIERFFVTDGQAACIQNNTGTVPNSDAAYLEYCADGNPFVGATGAARDIGIQIFDAFDKGGWEHSYALMLGNGNGIARGDNNASKDRYLYWSSEKVYGGRGPRRQGWKLFVWNVDGERTLLDSADLNTGVRTKKNYDRNMTGVGTTYRRDRWRAAVEYIKFDGMIYNGSTGGAIPGDRNTVAAGSKFDVGTRTSLFNVLPEEKADGMYLDVGYKVRPHLELDLRYDVYNRGTEVAANERKYTTLTLGAQYFFNLKTRLAVNYELRDQEAPNLPGSDNANLIADEIDDRISAQVTLIF